MKPLGYTFSGGYALCARHAIEARDRGSETGSVGVIYSNYEAHSNMVCNVAGCGIFLEKNCIDGCGTGGYDHFLYYDDPTEADFALKYVREEFDADAEVLSGPDESVAGYDYTIAFETSDEFSDEQAQELFQIVTPDGYDLNLAKDGDDDDDDESDFPEVFTERERDLAITEAEGRDWTIEYIARLERVAYTASVFCVKSCNLPVTLPKASYNKASLSVEDLAKELVSELATVDFMQ